ncbi:SusC/RagA family TonB-linked outer membrane protein [Chitinophagaceae bacterium LWZ2-11]
MHVKNPLLKLLFKGRCIHKYALGFLLLCLPSLLFAQAKSVTGTVKDADDKPLDNISITIKGISKATSTNAAGQFTITNVPAGNYTLIASSVGFSTVETPITVGATGPAPLNIKLTKTVKELDETVVIGYGTSKKRDLTDAVGKVSMPDLMKAPVRSFDEALAGRVAGVQVTSSDGQPGSSINIVVRGNNSVTQDNSPLYVVDGFPIENPNNNVINPADIESIEVLKDASATAIYGARGANGVILITTKKGKGGPAVISFGTSYGLQKTIKTMDMMSPYEFVKYQLEFNPALTAPTSPYPPTQLYLSGGTTMNYYKDTAGTLDWQSAVLRTAPIQNNTLSISGGNDKTKYYISGSAINQDGIIINSNYKRYQGRVSIDQTVDDKLKVGINANYSYLVQSGLALAQSTNSGTTNIMYSVWGMKPVSPSPASQAATGIIDIGTTETTSLTDPDVSSSNDYRFNPIINLKNIVRNNITRNLTANAYMEYAITHDLKLRVTGGITSNVLRNEAFNNSNTSYGNSLFTSNGANGSVIYNENNLWLNENTLTYTKRINKDHLFTVLAGMTEQGAKTFSYGVSAIKVPYESLGISDLDEGTPISVTATSSSNTMASFLGRVNYSYKSKYLLSASYRADGSSKFSPQHHWAYFPSAAAAWRFSEERFMKGMLPVLSDAKLRLSYGVSGNNRVSDFAYLATYGAQPSASNVYTFNNVPINGAIPLTIGNPDLKWETTSSVNLGLDLSFFKNRITLTADVYEKKTTNLLLNATLPTSTGYNTVYKNVGSVQNRGVELSISTINVTNKNFTWTSSFNIAFNGNKVINLAQNQETLLSNLKWDNGWQSTPAYIAKVGKPLGLMYGYISDGVYQYSDFNKTSAGGYILKDNVTTNGNTRANIQPGDIKYRDINGDLTVNASDYTVIGRSLPIHIGGFTNNFTYKGFDLSIFLQWSYGNDILNANRLVFDGNALNKSYLNQFASYENRWTPSHTNTDVFRTGGYYGGGYASRYVEDGSYLRLKTASLGYSFPQPLLKRLKLKSFRAYFSGQNLLTWTKYSGLDPEVNTYPSALTGGFDYSSYPRARTYTVGVNLSF